METYKERALAKANAKIEILKIKVRTNFETRHEHDFIGFDLKKKLVESTIRDIRTWAYIRSSIIMRG